MVVEGHEAYFTFPFLTPSFPHPPLTHEPTDELVVFLAQTKTPVVESKTANFRLVSSLMPKQL
ncbi:hypothetical protein Hanom_Chr17g01586371 [Helianthus anomalus]